ncbi:hypothetical protein ABVT39_020161, partial [Epinephelus coioides]
MEGNGLSADGIFITSGAGFATQSQLRSSETAGTDLGCTTHTERIGTRRRNSCARDGDEGLVTNLSAASSTAQPGPRPETAQNGPLMNTRQRLVLYWLR